MSRNKPLELNMKELDLSSSDEDPSSESDIDVHKLYNRSMPSLLDDDTKPLSKARLDEILLGPAPTPLMGKKAQPPKTPLMQKSVQPPKTPLMQKSVQPPKTPLMQKSVQPPKTPLMQKSVQPPKTPLMEKSVQSPRTPLMPSRAMPPPKTSWVPKTPLMPKRPVIPKSAPAPKTFKIKPPPKAPKPKAPPKATKPKAPPKAPKPKAPPKATKPKAPPKVKAALAPKKPSIPKVLKRKPVPKTPKSIEEEIAKLALDLAPITPISPLPKTPNVKPKAGKKKIVKKMFLSGDETDDSSSSESSSDSSSSSSEPSSPSENDMSKNLLREPKSPPKAAEKPPVSREVSPEEVKALEDWVESEGLNKGQNADEMPAGNRSDSPEVPWAEEVKALEDWVEREGLNEPLSDIAEYKILLDLAENYEENADLLVKLLTPAPGSLKNAPVQVRPQRLQPAEVLVQRIQDLTGRPASEILQNAMPLIDINKYLAPPQSPSVKDTKQPIQDLAGRPGSEILKNAMPLIDLKKYLAPAPPQSPSVKDVKQPVPQSPSVKDIKQPVPQSPSVKDIKQPVPPSPVIKKPLMTPQPSSEPLPPLDMRPSTSRAAMQAAQTVPKLKKINIIYGATSVSSKKPPVPKPAAVAPPPATAPVAPPVPVPVVPIPLPVPTAVPPKPQDVTKMTEWLGVCNSIVAKQLYFVEAMLRNEHQGKYLNIPTPETLPPFTIVDDNIIGFMKPLDKILSLKWFEKFGAESLPNLRRSVILATVPTGPPNRVLGKLNIIRRPVKREAMPVNMKYTNIYCSLQLNTTLVLRESARALERALYKPNIDVIQHSFDTIRLSWIWSDGTVMIINGTTLAALLETQEKLMTKLTGEAAVKPEPKQKILYISVVSHAQYPWPIDLAKFSQAEALCGPVFYERYVFYVTKDMPGVVARIHESGQVSVFAMNVALADKMVARLYTVASKYRVNAP